MKILVIEDEPAMRASLVYSLQREKYVVETASDLASAEEKIGIYTYDCILLDIGLPGGSGLTLLESLKKDGKSEGVIIISAKDSLEDKIRGLDLGADDYITKPFHLAELHARVKSVLRRKQMEGSKYVNCGNIRADGEQRTVWVGEDSLLLNRKEFDILFYLLVNKNRLVNKTALAEHVWGDYIDETNSYDFIYSQIKNLRKKLKDAGADAEIKAIYGVGYKLTGE
jgi:two-component system, OmpR family, response regulator ArlR